MIRKSIAQDFFLLAVGENGGMAPLRREVSNAGLMAAGVLDLEATGVEERVEPIRMTKRNYMKASRKKYRELKQKIMTDPIGYLTNNSNVRMTVKNEDGTPLGPGDLLRGYNPIELE